MRGVRLDHTALDKAGFTLLPEIVADDKLAEFENQIRRLGEIECSRHGVGAGASEPICAALSLGGDYRTMLFDKIKHLAIVQDITHDVVMRLRDGGVLARLGIEIPTFHQSLKGDLPNEDLFILPYHQDYKLTRSHKAFRAWIALRNVNAVDGSIEVASESHRNTFQYETRRDGFLFVPDTEIAGRYETEVIELPPGSGVLFNPLLVHRSVPNRGNRMRFALIVHIEDAASLIDSFDASGGRANPAST